MLVPALFKGFNMAFTVTLYSHSKRDNSTKLPTGSGTSYDCIMKHGCGILNPSISLDLGLSSDPSSFNYAYIPAFGRYYFIEEWYFEERLWTAQLRVDVLATYKTEIGDSNLYVLRSSAENNGRVTDLLYPAITGCDFDSSTHSNPWTGGTFIIGVVGRSGTYGNTSFYAISTSDMVRLCQKMTDREYIISEDYGFNLADASEALQLSLVDPLQYIKSCVYLPVDVGDITNTSYVANINVFNWESTAGGYAISSSSRIYKTYSFTIKKHPDTNTRGNYVNSCNASTLNVEVEVDPIGGKGILVVKCNGIILNRIESQIGVPIALSSVTRDYVGGITSTVGALTSPFSGSGVGAIGSMVGAIGNAVESLMPRAQTVGSTGSFVANRGEFRLDHQFFRPVADDNTHNGRPLCAMRTLKNLGGYMLIQDGDVTINGTSTEDSQIRNYLETGFYYE